MAAVVRGGPTSRPKPRAKAQASAPAPKSRASKSGGGKSRDYAPAKLSAARKVGLPPRVAGLVAAGAVGIGLVAAIVSGHHLQTIAASVGHGVGRKLAGAGFRVKTVTVQGATATAQGDIIKASGIHRGEPIIGLDLNGLRQRVETVGWVKQARVVRLLPDTLVLAVTQRDTLAVWQHEGRAQVIDPNGRVIPEADPSQFADLPLVVGAGANDSASAILTAVRSRPRLMQRMEALVRVDDRRWDLRMKDGGLIQLPAVGEDSALIQLDQLDQKSRILELGFARIDLRDPELVAVRPRDAGAPGQPPAGGA